MKQMNFQRQQFLLWNNKILSKSCQKVCKFHVRERKITKQREISNKKTNRETVLPVSYPK